MTHAPAPDLFDVIKARQRVPLLRYEVRALFGTTSTVGMPCETKADARHALRASRSLVSCTSAAVYDVWAGMEIEV
jgi:hypothetical protein